MKPMKKTFLMTTTALLLAVILAIPTVLPTFAQKASLGESSASSEKGSASKVPPADFLELFLSIAPSFHKKEELDLSISQTLAITRPEKTIYTDYSQYFITGTSDPKMSLYMDGEKIERLGKDGVFGVLVDLNDGKNTFQFSQGEVHKTAIIIKDAPPEEDIDFKEISEYSMVPSITSVYNAGDTLIFSCVAPSEAKVSAIVDGKTIKLEQVAEAEKGVPATFQKSYVLPDKYPSDKTTNVGKITYILDYQGKKQEFHSVGELCIAGENAKLMGRVNNYVGFVYPDVENLAVFKELLKENSTDYIVQQYGGYYELASGGYIPRSMMDIVTDKNSIDNELSDIAYNSKNVGEYFVFQGTETPAYFGTATETEFIFTLYNTHLAKPLSIEPSILFSGGKVEEKDNHVVITFTFRDPINNPYWGYNVVFGENNETFLEFKVKPNLVKSGKPLKNVTIMIDPGHGGDDVGASGPAGGLGPREQYLNLAHAYALEEQLTGLGATVYMTRYTDKTVELDDRLRQFSNSGADMFISLHHNSVDVNQNANLPNGTEAYYYTPFSEPLATNLVDSITTTTDRENRSTYQSYYRVTLLEYSPSVLVELGFISNPEEYEKACDPEEINRVVSSITGGILKTLA